MTSLYFEAKASKMDKIDNVLRLHGLEFPEGLLVLGRKDRNLSLALGAIERNCAGRQVVVTQRLCILYHAVIDIRKTNPSMGIISDAFYEAAIHKISKKKKKHPGISEFLTVSSLRHVIDVYLRAFVRSGLKLQKPMILTPRPARDFRPAQPNAAQNNGEGAEDSVKGSREELRELVAEWGAIRGAAGHDNTLAAQSTTEEPEIEGDTYPGKRADESDSSYVVRLQQFCKGVCDENKQHKKDKVQDKKDQTQLQNDNDELTKSFDELMTNFHAVVDGSEKLETDSLEQGEEIIDLKKEVIKLKSRLKDEREHHEVRTDQREARIELMQGTIARRNDEIDELQRRVGIAVRWEYPHDRLG